MTVLYVLQDNAVAFYGLVAFLGLMVGSFLNVVIHRLPIMMERAWREGLQELDAEQALEESSAKQESHEQRVQHATLAQAGGPDDDALNRQYVGGAPSTADGESTTKPFNLAIPRSRCPSCGHEITALENIPVVSYLFLRGKCSGCGTRISKRYPIVECVTMLLSLIVAWQFGATPQAALGIVVTWFLVAMTMIDFDHQLLPDNLTLPLMWIGLIASLFAVFTDVQSAVAGGALGYLILWSIYWLFKLITGKEGMGYGDFKLLAALGALLGWQALPMVILLSSLVGAVVGVSMIAIAGRDKNIPIPFGPYLAAAGWLAMLWGEPLTSWYYGMLG